MSNRIYVDNNINALSVINDHVMITGSVNGAIEFYKFGERFSKSAILEQLHKYPITDICVQSPTEEFCTVSEGGQLVTWDIQKQTKVLKSQIGQSLSAVEYVTTTALAVSGLEKILIYDSRQ
eukprot:UN26059